MGIKLKQINDFQTLLDAIKAEAYMLIYVKTPNCSVCQADLPRVEKIVEKLDVPSYLIDATEVPEAVGQFQLFTSPVVLLYYQGREFHRQARIIDFEELTYRIEQIQENT